jgi:hypothetical protein
MLAAVRPLHVPPPWVRNSRCEPWYIGVWTVGAAADTGVPAGCIPSSLDPSLGDASTLVSFTEPQAAASADTIAIEKSCLIAPIVE